MKVKVGNLELEVEGEAELDGKVYKIVRVPNADELKGYPPSWDFIKSSMLTYRPYFRGKVLEVNGQMIPTVGEYILDLDEEMYELLMDIYYTFKVNKPSIETNISTVITRQIDLLEQKLGKTFSEVEKTSLYIRYAVEVAILKDIGVIN
ncbi:MAG: hypothetical protein OWQ54_09690 [Sulfolobaceae archaeon]|nr:hypothetical protein [Sulfolobaceae archaeon]